MKWTAYLMIAVSCAVAPASAQVKPGQRISLVEYLQAGYAGITHDLLAAAEKMPDTDYGFKPTQMPEARTYAAVISHTAAAMFGACARVRGTDSPVPDAEKQFTKKAEIVQALKDSIAFCQVAFSALTAESAGDYVKQGPVEITRAAALAGVLAHNAEMYGISTVYLRARNLVPPGSVR